MRQSGGHHYSMAATGSGTKRKMAATGCEAKHIYTRKKMSDG